MANSRGGAKGIDWDAVRQSYGEGMTGPELSARYNVAERTIRERRENDALRGIMWPLQGSLRDLAADLESDPEPGAEVESESSRPTDGSSSNVVDFPGKKTANGTGGNRRTPPPPRARAPLDIVKYAGTLGVTLNFSKITIEDALALQKAMAVKSTLVGLVLLDRLAAGEIECGQHQSEADVAEKVASFIAKTAAMTREIAGLKAGMPSAAETNDDDARLIIEHQVIEPKVIATDKKGRAIA